MSTALLPSAVRPARTNTSQAAEYSSDPGSGGTAEDACCRYLASRALPDLRLGVLAAALSVLGAALRFFALRSVITMPTHDAWCGMQGSGPCVRESGLCVRELHGNGDLCAGRGSVRRLESATAAVSTGLRHLRARRRSRETSRGAFPADGYMKGVSAKQRFQINPRRLLAKLALVARGHRRGQVGERRELCCRSS